MTSKLTREEMQELISALRLTPTSTVNGISLGRLADALSENESAMDCAPVAADLIQLNMYLLSAENALEKETKYTRELEYRISEMQHNYRHAQPAPASEPIGFRCRRNDGLGDWFHVYHRAPDEFERKHLVIENIYTAPQPTPERDQVRREHAEWSQATFGDVGPVGPLKHLSKEALEAAAEPDDLSEWADMQFLLWDAQRRAGITDEQITQAMIEKLAVNKQREWPAPKDGEPRLHIKEQPAPVVPEEIISELEHVLDWILNTLPVPTPLTIPNARRLTTVINACRAAMLQAGNSPVIPDGYVMVPKEPTEAMINAWLSEVANWRGHVAGYKAMLAAAPQEKK